VCSAWVFTEANIALETARVVPALIDASDAPICKLLQGWALSHYCSAWFDRNEGLQASSAVLELYVRTEPPKNRVLKFWKELENALCSIAMADCVSFYPDVPVKCEGKTSWMGFERVLDWLGTQKL
jgi:hypothetical protein